MNQGVDRISSYHAHVYYDASTRDLAARIREQMGERFQVTLGRWHDKPVGPHPRWMYQVAFAPDQFAQLVPWLMLNREGLDVLVHPNSGHPLADHRDHAMWLGNSLALNLAALPDDDD